MWENIAKKAASIGCRFFCCGEKDQGEVTVTHGPDSLQNKGGYMEEKKMTPVSGAMIWFGAAVSIAEIMTGTGFASLGMIKGAEAILLGHLIGCALMYFAGLIGAESGKCSMDTVKISFGEKGGIIFAVLNVMQLFGWTAIMIQSGAEAADTVFDMNGAKVWCVIIGTLILIWILIGFRTMNRVNTVAMASLLILTAILSAVVFRGTPSQAGGSMTFGAAVELSVAMPLSWLPLVSDYTRYAVRKKKVTFVSAAAYFATSSWMYFIGMGASIYTGESDIAQIMMKAGLGIAAILIIVFSTVTTTFMDAFSAGVSSAAVFEKWNEKLAASVICILGTVVAVILPAGGLENFLYLIGSVFAPMTAVQITDYFILGNKAADKKVCWSNILLWFMGFVIYRAFMTVDTPLGSTFPVMLITGTMTFAVGKTIRAVTAAGEKRA